MTSLKELAERLEKATGPDRALDGLLAVLGGWEWHGDGGVERHETFAGHWVCPGAPANGSFGKRGPGLCDCQAISEAYYGNTRSAPRFTASLDAAIVLCERALPGCWWSVEREFVYDRGELRERFVGRLRKARDAYLHVLTAATPALALVLAVVRAKLSEEAE